MFTHIPVMKNEVLRCLSHDSPKVYLDMTAGGGGHAASFLEKHPGMKAVLVDRDKTAVEYLDKKFSDMKNVKVVHGESSEIEKLFFLLKIPSADIIFADLGVSSHQFDTDKRGFSFLNDGPLDMRMNIENKTTARDFIKEKTSEELQNILSRFAQERESKKVAKALKNAVEKGADTTFEIRYAVNAAKHYGKKRNNSHLAKIFMALRMAVNDETGQLERMLKSGFKLLSDNGVMGVLTFHSVEDRIVKRFFRDRKNSVSMQEAVGYCGDVEVVGPLNPSEEEISENNRSRSARLRILRKKDNNNKRRN